MMSISAIHQWEKARNARVMEGPIDLHRLLSKKSHFLIYRQERDYFIMYVFPESVRAEIEIQSWEQLITRLTLLSRRK